MAKANYSAMKREVVEASLKELGIATADKTLPGQVNAIVQHFRKTKVKLADCTVCRTASDESYRHCPYCGDVELLDAEDAAAGAAVAAANDAEPETLPEPVSDANAWPAFLTSGAVLRARAALPRNYVIDGVAERGDVVMLIGKEEGGKSMMAVDLAVTMLTGGEWMGLSVKPCRPDERVVYCAAEGGEVEPVRRARALARGRELDPDSVDRRVMVMGAADLRATGEADADVGPVTSETYSGLFELGKGRVGLIVVDPLTDCIDNQDENNAGIATSLMKGCERLAQELDCIVLVIHHTSREGEQRKVRAGRGSTAFESKARVVLRCSASQEPWRFEAAKMNNGPKFEPRTYEIAGNGAIDDTLVLSVDVGVTRAQAGKKPPNTGTEETVLKALRAGLGEWMLSSHITTVSNGTERKKALAGLAEKGLAETNGKHWRALPISAFSEQLVRDATFGQTGPAFGQTVLADQSLTGLTSDQSEGQE